MELGASPYIIGLYGDARLCHAVADPALNGDASKLFAEMLFLQAQTINVSVFFFCQASFSGNSRRCEDVEALAV
jgi:hypothetical protein